MAANDTIADMLTRIRNANLARHQTTQIPAQDDPALRKCFRKKVLSRKFKKQEKVKRWCFLEIQGKESPTTDHRLEAG